jgi:hypothetical protein
VGVVINEDSVMTANSKEKRWTAKGKNDRQEKKKRREKRNRKGKRGRKTREGQDLGGERQNEQKEQRRQVRYVPM